MGKLYSPEDLADRIFVVGIVGILIFVAVVFIFIL